VTLEDHVLFLKLVGDIFGRRSGNFNPSFGENGTGGNHEENVEEAVEGVVEEFGEFSGG
jgi:hypothetical protein